MEINKLTGEVIGAAIEVHKTLGPPACPLAFTAEIKGTPERAEL
jgi:hypothetical protein